MALKNFSLSFRSAFLFLVGLFLLLFFYRLILGFQTDESMDAGLYELANRTPHFSDQASLRKNYASEKSAPQPSAAPDVPGGFSQKYEKNATLTSGTDEFEKDESNVRQLSSDFNAIIQYEQRIGNPGQRSLFLMIGVRPELFDTFFVAVQRIGKIRTNEITKVDKTTEFRELNAKRASLEKALSNLTDLKNRAGSISDLVGLHDKILDIEGQIQALGVELGNFSAENEFCTFRFSLFENAATPTISLWKRILHAFTWTIQYYFYALIGFAFMLVVAWLLMVVINKAVELNAKK